MTLQDRKNSLLLNDGGLLKTVGVTATEEIQVQTKVVEALDFLVPVGFNVDVVDGRSSIYTTLGFALAQRVFQSNPSDPTVISH